MPNYTTNLNLEKPLQSEQYNVDVFNANADKIDQFAGQVPARALTADKLTTGAKINGVNFKGDTDIVTGAGFYYDTVTYGAGDLAFIYNQNNGLELHKSSVAGNIGHNPLTSTGYWEKVELGGSSRNIGEIIPSIVPLTDAGLHLLDGSRLSGDGIYKDFVDYIADLYTANPSANYFTTEANWQTAVTTYGVCGKFVYDSVNNTVRLPKITGIVEGTTDLTALGDLVQAGLPNITGQINEIRYHHEYMTATGAFSGSTEDGANLQNYFSNTKNSDAGPLNFNASNSNSIYGNSNTVQPQTIKILYYIVIATSTKTDIQVDIDEVVTDLNGKADVDLTNVNNQAKILMSGMAMPSSTYDDLTLGASGTTYTAPANGWYTIEKTSGVANAHISMINNNNRLCLTVHVPGTGNVCRGYIPALKGQQVNISYSATGTTSTFRFIYAEGSK